VSTKPGQDQCQRKRVNSKAAAGNPLVYVQMKAGHSQSQITERYIHAAQVLFPGAAAKDEARMFALTGDGAHGIRVASAGSGGHDVTGDSSAS